MKPYSLDFRNAVSLLVAISKTGVVGFDIIKGACTGETFANFIRSLDAPPQSRILLDNASIHKTNGARSSWPPSRPWAS